LTSATGAGGDDLTPLDAPRSRGEDGHGRDRAKQGCRNKLHFSGGLRHDFSMRKLILPVTALLATTSAWSAPYTAKLYDLQSSRSKVLFKAVRTEETKGDELKATVRFTQPDGTEPALTEEIWFEKGNLKRYLIHSKVPPAEGALEIREGKVWFKWDRVGEKPKSDDEDMVDNLVIGPMIVPYLQRPDVFEKLKQDESIKLRFASVERNETVGFTFSRSRLFKEGDRELLEIKMKASSFIIAAIVDPLYFVYDVATRKCVYVKGRTLPKQLVDGKWKDLDVEFVYD
jgi:hypothetical protein